MWHAMLTRCQQTINHYILKYGSRWRDYFRLTLQYCEHIKLGTSVLLVVLSAIWQPGEHYSFHRTKKCFLKRQLAPLKRQWQFSKRVAI